MADVFLSYRRPDKPIARQIEDRLEKAKITVWWDDELETGSAFPLAIQNEVEAAKALVVLWSHHSVNSRWVVAEAHKALELERLIVPVRLDDCSPPIPFNTMQALDWKALGAKTCVARVCDELRRALADDTTATIALQKEAEAGDAGAQVVLSTRLAEGDGAAKNQELAKLWLQRAAAQGDAAGRVLLATMQQGKSIAGGLARSFRRNQP